MDNQFSPWHVPRDAGALQYGFFLSHVAEDAPTLKRLKQSIFDRSRVEGQELSCFLDVHDWPIAGDLIVTIENSLYSSEFFVAWVSEEYLHNHRGWVWIEFALANLLEISINQAHHGLQFPFVLPIFWGVSLADIERTPWLTFWSRRLPVDYGDSLDKVASRLVDFYFQERLRRSPQSR